MTDSPGGPWARLVVGHHWPSAESLQTIESAAANRKMLGEALGEYAIAIRNLGNSIAAEQRGLTADHIEETFRRGEHHSQSISEKSSAIQAAYDAAHQSTSQLRSNLRDIADRAKHRIQEIQQSNQPTSVKVDMILEVVAAGQAEASASAAVQSDNVLAAIQSVLNATGVATSARQLANSHGVELTSAFRSRHSGTNRDSIKALLDAPTKAPVAASADGQQQSPTGTYRGAVSRPDASQQKSGVSRFSPVVPLNTTSSAGTGQVASGTTIATASTPSVQPNSTTPGASTVNSVNVPNQSSPASQAGAPTATGNAGVSTNPQRLLMESPPRPTTPATATGAHTATTQPAIAPAFESAHTPSATISHPAMHPVSAPQLLTPKAPITTPASPSPHTLSPSAFHNATSNSPTGAPPATLPAYGADIRPATSSANTPPLLSAPPVPTTPLPATPTSAPLPATQVAAGATQPAVTRQPIAITGQTSAAVAAMATPATAAGAAIGATTLRTANAHRLQALLQSVARQESRLRWAIGSFDDDTTVLTTDLAGGWIPPMMQLPTCAQLLQPLSSVDPIETLLAKSTQTAIYVPGQPLSAADQDPPIRTSTSPRRLAPLDDFGWALTRATKWRDTLPRIAYTLAKSATAGTGHIDAEVDLLHKHLDLVANETLNTYPNQATNAIGNWQLLAAVAALIDGEKTCANYHLAWFRALNPDQGSRQ